MLGKWQYVDEPRQAQAWEARVYYRAFDGELRDVRATERRRGDAEELALRRVQDRLRGRQTLELAGSTRLLTAGDWFLAQIARTDSGLSPRTVADYTAAWHRYVIAPASPIRGLTLHQVNDPQRLTGFLRFVADRHGTGASKMVRSVLAGLFRYSVENGVISSNALRQVRAVRSVRPRQSERDHERAFTRAERDSVIAYADSLLPDPLMRPNPRSVRKAQAVADLAALLAGTGMRIEEARSCRWEHVDLAAATLFVAGTKSSAAARRVNLPDWLRDRLQLGSESGGTGYVLSSPARHDPESKWDQSNSSKAMRELLDGAGFPWAVPHTFRRTVATLLHEAGVPIARIADQLGHSDPSLTARVYLGRDFGGGKADLAAIL